MSERTGRGSKTPIQHANNRRGMRTAEYTAWANMKQRCSNPRAHFYVIYGARGITFCDRWKVFANFLADMGTKPSHKHTLERMDTNGNYCKENCIWAVPATQSRNKRNNVFVEYAGQRLCIKDMAAMIGIKCATLRYRLLHGWPIESAIQLTNLHSRSKGK